VVRAEAGEAAEGEVAVQVPFDMVGHPPQVLVPEPGLGPGRAALLGILAEQVDGQGGAERFGQEPEPVAPRVGLVGELACDRLREGVATDRRRPEDRRLSADPLGDLVEQGRREVDRDRLERPLPADEGGDEGGADHDVARRRPARVGPVLAEVPLDVPGAGQDQRT